jgi:hypothetical protein
MFPLPNIKLPLGLGLAPKYKQPSEMGGRNPGWIKFFIKLLGSVKMGEKCSLASRGCPWKTTIPYLKI